MDDNSLKTYRSYILLLLISMNSIVFGWGGGMLYTLWYTRSLEETQQGLAIYINGPVSDPFAILTLIVGVLGVIVGISVFLPHYVSNQLIKTQARSVLQEAMNDIQNDLIRNLKETRKTDAHVSRMIGIHESRTGSLIWSIGWLTRSLKRYVRLLPDNPHYTEFILLDLDVLCTSVERVVPLDMSKKYYYYGVGQAYLVELAMHRIYSNSVQSEEKSTRPAIRACKDLVDLLILMERGLDQSTSKRPLNSMNGLDYSKITRAKEVIHYFTSCLQTSLMSRHPEFTEAGKYTYLARSSQRAFASEIAELSEEQESYKKSLELIEIKFEKAYKDLHDALNDYFN